MLFGGQSSESIQSRSKWGLNVLLRIQLNSTKLTLLKLLKITLQFSIHATTLPLFFLVVDNNSIIKHLKQKVNLSSKYTNETSTTDWCRWTQLSAERQLTARQSEMSSPAPSSSVARPWHQTRHTDEVKSLSSTMADNDNMTNILQL